MKQELIISTEHTLGGSPRLEGRRMDVGHVIKGITQSEDDNFQSYQSSFEVSTDQVRHAIMYCKDQICELQTVPQSCSGCSKKFRKDAETWEKFLIEMGGIEPIETDGDPVIKLGDNSIYLGELEELKEDFEGIDIWEMAQVLHRKLKAKLNLPGTYEQLINHVK